MRRSLPPASIEGYRVLVSAVTDNAKIPTEVSLLDYAGFRYDANPKARPIRWDDMATAVSFARKTWDALPSVDAVERVAPHLGTTTKQ